MVTKHGRRFKHALGIDIRSDIKAAKKVWLPWWGVLTWMVFCLPIIWLFDHFGRLDLAMPALSGIGLFGFIITLKWTLRRYVWFWTTMTIIAALHVPLILFVHWTTRWVPAAMIAGIVSVDFFVIITIVAAIGNLVQGPNVPGG